MKAGGAVKVASGLCKGQWSQVFRIHIATYSSPTDESASPVQRLKDGLRVAFGDAEKGAGGAFRLAVALFPVLQGAGTDADEGGKAG
jgi:hypothetical protein